MSSSNSQHGSGWSVSLVVQTIGKLPEEPGHSALYFARLEQWMESNLFKKFLLGTEDPFQVITPAAFNSLSADKKISFTESRNRYDQRRSQAWECIIAITKDTTKEYIIQNYTADTMPQGYLLRI